MAHYGTLREFRFGAEIDDVRGARVFGNNDEKLGEVEDVIFDHESGNIRYAVVNTGGWLKSRLFLIPANLIQPRSKDASDFEVPLSKEQVERLPPYNEKMVEDHGEFSSYESAYRKELESGPVLHRAGSDHIVTPDAEDLPPATGNETAEGFDVTPTRIAGKFTDTAPDPDKIRLRPSGTAARAEDQRLVGSAVPAEKPTRATEIGENRRAEARNERFSAFEEHLRKNRIDITARCLSCGVARDRVA